MPNNSNATGLSFQEDGLPVPLGLPWQAVDSSNLAEVAWRSESLYVRFVSGAVYRYDGFERAEYQALTGAPSVGKYFTLHIRDQYHTTRLVSW